MNYYIVNLSHTKRTDKYVTFWRPDAKGYAWPLSWAGEYPEETVKKALAYYNSGENIAVPCGVVNALVVAPEPKTIDGDAGPVVCSNARNWKKLLAAAIAKPTYMPCPLYRGARRKKAEYT